MNKTSLARILALGSLAALALIVMLWVFSIEDENNRLIPFIIGMLPLLLLLRGILYGKIKTHQAAVFVALLYLIHGSVELFEEVTLIASAEVLASLALMGSAAFYAKWKTASA